MMSLEESKEVPSIKTISVREGYNQTYIIYPKNEKTGDKDEGSDEYHEVFFRCGNWCYKGPIDFGDVKIETSEIQVLIPTLQKQQNSLKFFCGSSSIAHFGYINDPITFVADACEFIASEISSLHVGAELKKWSSVFSWIDDDNASTYFELNMEVPPFMSGVELIASKTYTHGLIMISIYYDGTLYFVLQAGEGDQHLLDVRFPNVSSHGQGLHIASYKEDISFWRKLTLWHTIDMKIPREMPVISTTNLSSSNYIQTYCIARSDATDSNGNLSVYHDALFRFGSWCYSGKVQLTPVLNLNDIPFVIPALRMQQSRLSFLCDVLRMPNSSPFTKPMEYMHQLNPIIEEEIYKSESILNSLIDRLSKMGLGGSVSKWLEGDASNSFFEFRMASTPELEKVFRKIELVASKVYHPSGIITVLVYYQKTIYVSVIEGGNENPLLDSRFPDVSAKGRGYQLQSYDSGISGWPELRKITIWQTVSSLEQEFRDRAAALAQQKVNYDNGNGGDNGNNGEDGGSYNDGEGGDESGSGEDAKRRRGYSYADRAHDVANVFDEGYDISSKKEVEDDSKAVSIQHGAHSADSKSTTRTRGRGASVEDRIHDVANVFDDGYEINTKQDDNEDIKGVSSSSRAPAVSIVESPVAQAKRDEPSLSMPSMRSMAVARPHHLPKMDQALSKRMDQIRSEMGVEGAVPNWNAKGKPLSMQSQDSK